MTIKLYDENSYLTEFEAVVKSCEKTDSGYRVILDKTAFFPEEGGQCCDRGCLDGINVTKVEISGDEIYHYVESPFENGQKIKGKIDFEPRFRNMQNHSGEHIICGIAHSLFGYENVGFHLGEDIVTMDLSGELSDSDISKIEKMANEAVAKNMPVTAFYPSPDELETLDYRAKGEIEGDVRIVTIGDVDTCACCAPHVKQTGEIGIIKIVDSMRHRGGMRLSILCGFDALSDYNMRMKEAKEISNLLSVPQSEIASGVKKLNSDLQLMKTKISDMKKQIVKLTVESVQPDKDVLCLFFDDMDMDGLRFGANILLDKKVPFAVLLSGDDENGYSYVLVTSDGDITSHTKSANEALSGRGGGKAPMATGRFAAKSSDIEKYFVK
ncbi:MAG: hypothetical protein IKV88_00565 [Clostridia bacterium]|nr:hypothetical protein [Clostridia bacterium]